MNIKNENIVFKKLIVRGSSAITWLVLIHFFVPYFPIPQMTALYFIVVLSLLIVMAFIFMQVREGIAVDVLYRYFAIAVLPVGCLFLGCIGSIGLESFMSFKQYMYVILVLFLIALGYLFLNGGPNRLKFQNIFWVLYYLIILMPSNIVAFNTLFDQTEPKLNNTIITKYIEDYPENDYYLFKTYYELYPKSWSKEYGKYNKINVTRETYRMLAPGTEIAIKEYEGLLGIKWYTVHHNGVTLNSTEWYLGRNKQPLLWNRNKNRP